MQNKFNLLEKTKKFHIKDFEKEARRKSEVTKGAFHLTKTFENLETAANGTEMSPKSFQKFRKLLNFRNANHSTENSRNPGSKVEWKANSREKFLKIWVYLARLSSFVEILENALPLTSGSCRKFKADVLVERKAPDV